MRSSPKICCPRRWQQHWLFFFCVLVFLLGMILCYDPCPESLRRSSASTPPNIPKSEIEKAFQEADKIVKNKTEQERRLVREGKVVNRRVKSAESTHQQAFVKPEVREKELKQRTFQEASIILTKKYGLRPDEVCCSLPKCDLNTPTASRAVQNCVNPEPIQCDSSSRYRTADGTCNNLENPTWGSALSCFNRLLPAVYGENETFRRSVNGDELPSPRTLSLDVNSHQNRPTDYVTHLYMFFGQLLDHDITLTSASTTADNEAIECCPDSNDNHPQCAPVLISPNDEFYAQFSVSCLNFVRSAICNYCTTGPRVQVNQVTAHIDASFVYGNSQNETNGLRNESSRGNLRVQESNYGYLPPQSDNPANDQCSVPSANQMCFQTGDVRGNQHPALTSLHTIYLREHNRVVDILRALNTRWDEERIFQESRKIVGAEMQVITYKEYLPVTLGYEAMDDFNLWIRPGTQTTTYNRTADATLDTEFSSAAFRFGHSMINSCVLEVPGPRECPLLRDEFFSPFGLYNGDLDRVMRGSTMSPSQYFDRYVVPDVKNFLYRARGNDTGFDLPAFNIQRGRDHGLQPYVEMVRFCTNPPINITCFDDLKHLMPYENVYALRRNYNDVRDIDLWEGIVSEFWEPGAVVGRTAICIIGRQFNHLKYGDRFYFEHDGVFTPWQRSELKKVGLATIICQNTAIQEIQERPMLFDDRRNPVRLCNSLPSLDLNAWRE